MCWFGRNNFSVADDSPILLSESCTLSYIKRAESKLAGEMQIAVLFSGQSVLTLRIKSTAPNSKRDPQGQTEGLTDLSKRKLAIALVVICAALMVITAFYALITATFAEVNPVAAVAAISVGVAGIAWFRKASFHK